MKGSSSFQRWEKETNHQPCCSWLRAAHVVRCTCACVRARVHREHLSCPLPPVPPMHIPTFSDSWGWITISIFCIWVERAQTLQLSRLRNFYTYKHWLPKSKYSFQRDSMVSITLQIKPQLLLLTDKGPVLSSHPLTPQQHPMPLWPFLSLVESGLSPLLCLVSPLPFPNSSNNRHLTYQVST